MQVQTDQELRIHCLDEATRAIVGTEKPEHTVARAQAYFEFIKQGEKRTGNSDAAS